MLLEFTNIYITLILEITNNVKKKLSIVATSLKSINV